MLLSEQGDYGRYLERLKAVSHATDRTVYIEPALKLAQEHPVLGGGVSSFAYRYVNDFVLPSGVYFSPGGGPLNRTFNNAHSLWLGLLVGQGYLGVLAMLGMLMATALTARGIIRKVRPGTIVGESGIIEPLVWVAFLCSAVSLGVYGLFDDTFYVASNVVVLFLLAGISLGASRKPRLLGAGFVRISLALIFLVFLTQAVWEFVAPGKGRHLTFDPGSDGCYRKPQERSEGRFSVWCSEHAQLDVPVATMSGQRYASLELVLPPNGGRNPEVIVDLSEKRGGSPTLRIESAPPGEPFWILVPVDPEIEATDHVRLEILVSEYLVPLRNPELQSLDRRRLAFGVPPVPTAFSEAAGSNARCIEIPTEDDDWRDLWCAGGGRIPLPANLGQRLDVSVRLMPFSGVRQVPVYAAFSTQETLEGAVVTLLDENRKLIARAYDAASSPGLKISSTRPARELDPMGGLGFVVGFRVAQD
jgi:hypothetical protein